MSRERKPPLRQHRRLFIVLSFPRDVGAVDVVSIRDGRGLNCRQTAARVSSTSGTVTSPDEKKKNYANAAGNDYIIRPLPKDLILAACSACTIPA